MSHPLEPVEPEAPRSLRHSEAILARRSWLRSPHVEPLAQFVRSLRTRHPAWEFPEFDPLDGGTNADTLFLFEKPGPMTAAGGGSGFISRDNDDPTAEATFLFMREAGLLRRRTVIWNVVPGWNGTRKIAAGEVKEGVKALEELLGLLRNVRAVVLVGKRAQTARSLLEPLSLRLLQSAHPSPLVRASRPEEWRAIPLEWAKAL